MAKFNVVDMNGQHVSEIELSDAVFGITPNEKAVHIAVVNFLAAVLHCHLLPGVRGRTHPAVWLGRKETGLFPLMKGRELDHGTA